MEERSSRTQTTLTWEPAVAQCHRGKKKKRVNWQGRFSSAGEEEETPRPTKRQSRRPVKAAIHETRCAPGKREWTFIQSVRKHAGGMNVQLHQIRGEFLQVGVV